MLLIHEVCDIFFLFETCDNLGLTTCVISLLPLCTDFFSRSKDKTAVKKVKFAKTRSSPRLRAALSRITSSETTEVIHLDESPTATSPSEKAAASSEGASDAVAATSAGVSDDAVFQLAAAATVTAVVEDIASVAVAVECENEVVPNIVHDGSEGISVRITFVFVSCML